MVCKHGYAFEEMASLIDTFVVPVRYHKDRSRARPVSKYDNDDVRKLRAAPIRTGYQRRSLAERMTSHPAAAIIRRLKASPSWLAASYDERRRDLSWVDDKNDDIPWWCIPFHNAFENKVHVYNRIKVAWPVTLLILTEFEGYLDFSHEYERKPSKRR